MKKRSLHNSISLLSLLLFVLTSCHKSDDPQPIAPPVSDVDVYAVGGDGDGAKLWKNGTAISLNSGDVATDIAVSGTDIYISGYDNQEDKSFFTAKYWKNGVAVNLTDGTRDAFAYGITVHGNDVYVAGCESAPGKYTYIAKYWKNGVAVSLNNADENASVSSIAVVGNDIYAIGEHNQYGRPSVACYWKNGQLTNLSDESTSAEEQTIAISGSDIYMMWSASYNNKGQSQTSYSENFGPSIKLTDARQNFHGYSIAASGNDVYVAGNGLSADGTTFGAGYFKNGTPALLTSGTESDDAISIALSGSDVYVAGGTENVAAGKFPTACYWKNGNLVLLGDGTSQSLVRKILVVKK